MKSKSSCFLNSPEWQSLLLQGPSDRSQISEIPSLKLRSRLHILLIQIPDLIVEGSATKITQAYQNGSKGIFDLLLQRISNLFYNVKNWLTLEAEPHYLPYDASSSQFIDEYIIYPDIISGVLDSVANTALLILDRMYCSLYSVKLEESSVVESRSELHQWLRNERLLDDPEDAEWRRLRIIRAFEFVRQESTLAAKPLEFGLRQAQSRSRVCLFEAVTR